MSKNLLNRQVGKGEGAPQAKCSENSFSPHPHLNRVRNCQSLMAENIPPHFSLNAEADTLSRKALKRKVGSGRQGLYFSTESKDT